MSASKFLIAAMCAFTTSLVSCGPATPTTRERSAAKIEPARGFADPDDPQAANWWITSPESALTVRGDPSSVVAVAMMISPTPCGPAVVSLAGRESTVKSPIPVSATVSMDPAGAGELVIRVSSPFCRSTGDDRTLFAMVSNASGRTIAKTTDPLLEPVSGFDRREFHESGQYGWWMTSPKGGLRVSGRPGAKVSVRVSLVPAPCSQRSTIVFASKTRTLGRTASASLDVTLDASGEALLPIEVTSQPCSPAGDPRPLYAMVFDPVLRVED